jgi:hypothetical protein
MMGAVTAELQDLLEQLIDEACPDWDYPDCERPARETPDGEDPHFWAYHYTEVMRLRLSRALLADPELTVRLAPRVFQALLLEPALTDQLVFPLADVLGRRRLLEELTGVVEGGSAGQRVHAASAVYHLGFHRAPERRAIIRQVREAVAAGLITSRNEVEEFLSARRAAVPDRPIDRIDDLRPRFWLACLAAFVSCDDAEARRHLQTAFPLGPEHYPSDATAHTATLLSAAREIAQADPERFERLLRGSTGYGAAI